MSFSKECKSNCNSDLMVQRWDLSWSRTRKPHCRKICVLQSKYSKPSIKEQPSKWTSYKILNFPSLSQTKILCKVWTIALKANKLFEYRIKGLINLIRFSDIHRRRTQADGYTFNDSDQESLTKQACQKEAEKILIGFSALQTHLYDHLVLFLSLSKHLQPTDKVQQSCFDVLYYRNNCPNRSRSYLDSLYQVIWSLITENAAILSWIVCTSLDFRQDCILAGASSARRSNYIHQYDHAGGEVHVIW